MGRVVASTSDQREILLTMHAAIVQHASHILGEFRDADPKSVARTRGLLAPIDNFHARVAGNASRAAAPATPRSAAEVEATVAA